MGKPSGPLLWQPGKCPCRKVSPFPRDVPQDVFSQAGFLYKLRLCSIPTQRQAVALLGDTVLVGQPVGWAAVGRALRGREGVGAPVELSFVSIRHLQTLHSTGHGCGSSRVPTGQAAEATKPGPMLLQRQTTNPVYCQKPNRSWRGHCPHFMQTGYLGLIRAGEHRNHSL